MQNWETLAQVNKATGKKKEAANNIVPNVLRHCLKTFGTILK